MPLFSISKNALSTVAQKRFASEKHLQQLIEKNLDTVFKCRFVATEFSTGSKHAGRIDTLALSEDDNPVIIEYKVVESSDLLNQSLFYLSWIQDHRGDFTVAAKQALGEKVVVDWSDVRVICIAPQYRKYDLHAAHMMGANIELWTYRLFANDVLYFEEVLHKSDEVVTSGKNPVMVEAGKKAAATGLRAITPLNSTSKGNPRRRWSLRNKSTISYRTWILLSKWYPRSSMSLFERHRTSSAWTSRTKRSCFI